MSDRVLAQSLAGEVLRHHAERLWFIDRSSAVVGPFSTWEVALAAKNHLLQPTDRLWKDGLDQWHRVSDIPGLLPALTTPLPRPKHAERPMPSLAADLSAVRTTRHAVRTGSSPPPAAPHPVEATGSWLPAAPFATTVASAAATVTSAAATVTSAAATVTSAAASDQPGTATRRLAESIARQIVQMLDRYEIRTIDDIATNERLRHFTGVTFDALPFSVRATLTHTIGRSFIEDRIFDLLLSLRSGSLSPKARTMDLRQLVLDQAPNIAVSIDTAIAETTSAVGTIMSSHWATVAGLLGEKRAPVGPPLVQLAPQGQAVTTAPA